MSSNVTEEHFVVSDRVAPTIRVKLDQIASAAGKAETAEMRLAAAQVRAASSAGAAAERLAQAQHRTAGAAATAAAAHVRLIREQERSAAMSLRQAAARDRGSAADDRATASLLKLSQAHLRAETSFKRSQAAKGSAGGGWRETLGQAGQGAATGGGVGSAVMGSVGRAASSNPYLAAGAVAVGGIAAGVATHVKYADQYAGLQNTLKNVTGSVETTSLVLARLNEIANKTFAPIDAAAEGYARFSRALQPLGKSQEDVLQFTETLNGMLFAYGKTGGEAASVTLQLTQAMGKGKLDGDEFRSVMENLPELGTAIAKELGVTRGELIKLAPQGKITADVIYNAMGRAKEQIESLPPPVMRLDGALTKVQNGMTIWFGQLEESTGFTSIFVKAIGSIGDALDGLAKRQMNENLLDKNLFDAGAVKRFLKLTDEQAADPKIAAQIREVSAAYQEANLRRNAGLESTEGASEEAFKALQKLQGQADEYKAAAVEIAATEAVAAKRRGEVSDVVDARIKGAERELELAKMTEEQRFIAIELDKTQNDLREKGADLSALEVSQQEHLKKVLGETYALQKKAGGGRGVDRAAEMAKINLSLDNQILRMHALSEERARQQQFDRIEEGLAGKRIALTNEEAESIQTRIRVIQEGNRLQGEADRIYTESTAAVDQYTLAIEANQMLLEQGSISQGTYVKNVRMATLELEKAQSPLYDLNKSLADQQELLGANARDRAIDSQLMAIENDLREKGLSLTSAHSEAYRRQFEQLRALQEQRAAEDAMLGSITEKQRQLNLQTQVYLQSREQLAALGQDATARMQVANDNGLDLSGTGTDFAAQMEAREAAEARIQQLRELGVINEQEASTAKMRIWQVEQQSKLDMAQGFFGNFTGLMRSENKEIAAIGKAAAIANATITTYQAANAAFAAMAGIPIVGPALGAAAAAGAIASGLVNVAAIASAPTGFKQGGYTGNVPANDVAGVVHGREYVMDAASTARLGRSNLDALRSGDASVASKNGGGTGPSPTINVVVVSSIEEARAWLAGKEGEAVIVNAVGKNAKQLSRQFRAAG